MQGADWFKAPLKIEVASVSPKAAEAVKAAGGAVETRYLNSLALRAHLKPEKFKIIPKSAAPPPRLRHKFPLSASKEPSS